MFATLQKFLPGAILLLLLSSCVAVPAPVSLNDQPLQLIAVISSELFAGAPDRNLIALGGDGLQLLDVSTRLRKTIDSREPVALVWRRDGAQLAAVFAADDGQGQLAIYAREGRLVEQSDLPAGVPVALDWSRHDDLLVAGFRLREFSFGGNLAQWLVRINGEERTVLELGDTTLKPATARMVKTRLAELLKVSFSPAGDELVFMQLHDPPQFAAYLQLVHRNWQVAKERKLLELPLQPAAIAWGDAEDTVVYRSAAGTWQRLPLWPADGEPSRNRVAISEPSELAADDKGVQRFADGGYLLAAKGRLYLGSGLAPLPTGGDDRAWTLRKWRFEGLITPAEYLEVRP